MRRRANPSRMVSSASRALRVISWSFGVHFAPQSRDAIGCSSKWYRADLNHASKPIQCWINSCSRRKTPCQPYNPLGHCKPLTQRVELVFVVLAGMAATSFHDNHNSAGSCGPICLTTRVEHKHPCKGGGPRTSDS